MTWTTETEPLEIEDAATVGLTVGASDRAGLSPRDRSGVGGLSPRPQVRPSAIPPVNPADPLGYGGSRRNLENRRLAFTTVAVRIGASDYRRM